MIHKSGLMFYKSSEVIFCYTAPHSCHREELRLFQLCVYRRTSLFYRGRTERLGPPRDRANLEEQKQDNRGHWKETTCDNLQKIHSNVLQIKYPVVPHVYVVLFYHVLRIHLFHRTVYQKLCEKSTILKLNIQKEANQRRDIKTSDMMKNHSLFLCFSSSCLYQN